MTDTAAKAGDKAAAPVPAAASAPVVASLPVAASVKPASVAPVAKKAAVVAKPAGEPIETRPIKTRPVKAKPIQKKPAAIKPAPIKSALNKQKPSSAAPKAAPAVKEITMNDTVKTITDKTKTFFADANDRTKGAMEKGAKAFEDMGAFQKGNLEAVVESSKIAAKGAEDIAKYSVEYAKGAVEKANANVRKLATVKSPTEFFQLQTEFAREAMDSVASEGAKFTENYLKLLGQIAQPYQNRFAVAAEKVKAAA